MQSKAEEHVHLLQVWMPELFRMQAVDWLDEFTICSERLDSFSILESLLADLNRLSDNPDIIPELRRDRSAVRMPTGFPGAPTGFGGFAGGTPPPPDALAFYLPFHFFPDWWGVYLFVEGVQTLASYLEMEAGGELSSKEAIRAAKYFLYGHEHYHHIVECFAARLEITNRRALYIDGFCEYYEKYREDDDRSEEALANGCGARTAIERLKKEGLSKSKLARIQVTLQNYFVSSFHGYRGGITVIEKSIFESKQHRLAEESHQTCLQGRPQVDPSVWMAFPHAFDGFAQINSRVNYILPPGVGIPARLDLAAFRYFRYKDVARALRALKAEFSRPGKGSHEIWRAASGGFIVVPKHPGDIKLGTLRNIAQQAGFEGSLHDFINAD